jgi:hypothetical protein
MGHQRVYPAAVAGKRRGSKARRASVTSAGVRRLAFGAATLLAALAFNSTSYAQSTAFAGMAGFWSGAGTVTLDDGSTERIRCRASYAVSASGAGLNQTLLCASDSYKFDFKTNVMSEQGSLSGTWNESTRGISGQLQGRGNNGNFQVVATAAGFTANISLTTRGDKQSVVIKPDSQFKGATITLTRP